MYAKLGAVDVKENQAYIKLLAGTEATVTAETLRQLALRVQARQFEYTQGDTARNP